MQVVAHRQAAGEVGIDRGMRFGDDRAPRSGVGGDNGMRPTV